MANHWHWVWMCGSGRRQLEAITEATVKGILVAKQSLAAEMGFYEGELEFQKGLGTVPKAEAAAEEATRLFEEARDHAAHARAVLAEARRLPEEAAVKAARAIEEEVRQEAYAAADRAAAAPPPEQSWKEVAEAVAEAMEPYHLGQLRAQRETAITYARAKSFAVASVNLTAEAETLAATAQAEQASGLTLQAEHTMGIARKTVEKAHEMKDHAQKLYGRAEEINDSVRGYQIKQQQAAAAAAAAVMGQQEAMPISQPVVL
mmetsp:Transcript_21144/g.66296  ORF Transcript_21144/g.66296 Transcript_21144/m.66296 type:complete len:261 (+) Transcript_21144:151-933(+)